MYNVRGLEPIACEALGHSDGVQEALEVRWQLALLQTLLREVRCAGSISAAQLLKARNQLLDLCYEVLHHRLDIKLAVV